MPVRRHIDRNVVIDVVIRVLLFVVYAIFQVLPPFTRVIHPEEIWLHKYPVTESYCPMNVLWEFVVIIPSAAIFINYLINRDKTDVIQAFLCFSLILGLNGAVTNVVKVLVGRPRPDFYHRCFPNGIGNSEMECTGNEDLINDGRKSFPSGHSSISFASFGFLSLYLASKLHVFTPSYKGNSWRLLTVLMPYMVATSIAISRTCDYHHHWQDVLCGSLLGFGICWLCYYHYYPSLTSNNCHIPWVTLNKLENQQVGVNVKQI